MERESVLDRESILDPAIIKSAWLVIDRTCCVVSIASRAAARSTRFARVLAREAINDEE